MTSEYVLEIKYLSFREKPEVDRIKFNGIFYDVKIEAIETIVLSQAFFEEDESKNSSIKLFHDSNLVNECILEIFRGSNRFYCFLDEKGYTFQLLFITITPTIKIPLYKDKYYNITDYDTNNTKNRKRYTFINANFFSILINDKYFTLQSFMKNLKSYQLSVYNLEQKLIVTKSLLLDEEDNFIQNYFKYNSSAFLFKNKIQNLINKNKVGNIKKCLDNFINLNIEFYLNKSKLKLSKIFNNILYIDFYANVSLYKIITIHQNNESIKYIIEYYLRKIKEINENSSLKIYQKILLIECFSGLFYHCKSKEELEKASFIYYSMEEKEDNSVLDLIEKFFKEYREKLTEESPVFRKLIELDGDSGFYNEESYYCFNMKNLDEMRKDLNEIESNNFVIYDLNNKNLAVTNITSGVASVNIHHIKQFKYFDIPLNKKLPEDKKEIGEIIAAKIIYYLLHEINGHKKFSYKKNKSFNSPIKFIENGNIYTLCQKNSLLKGKNIIKIVPNNITGEDGYFYELCYGKIIDYYTFEIIDNVDDFSDLLSEVDLWVNKFDKLRDYFKYKYALQKYGSKFKSKKLTIDDKINEYKNECLKLQKETKIYLDTFFIKEKVIDKHKKKKYDDFKKYNNINLKKEKNKIDEESGDGSDSSKNSGMINDIESETSKKNENDNIKMEDDEIDEEKESEMEEKTEKEEKIDEEEKIKIFMQFPYETLLALEKTGVLTKEQVNIYRERRRRASLESVRYSSVINNNT